VGARSAIGGRIMAFGEESDGDSAAFVTALVRHQRRI
jgi:hypothetical protein